MTFFLCLSIFLFFFPFSFGLHFLYMQLTKESEIKTETDKWMHENEIYCARKMTYTIAYQYYVVQRREMIEVIISLL